MDVDFQIAPEVVLVMLAAMVRFAGVARRRLSTSATCTSA
jgi:hypothetical protein